jgi:hypothetical protein
MTKVGAKKQMFSPDAIEMITSVSHGIPRTINILCDTALVYAYSQNAPAVHSRIVSQVLHDKAQYGALPAKTVPREALPLVRRAEGHNQ